MVGSAGLGLPGLPRAHMGPAGLVVAASGPGLILVRYSRQLCHNISCTKRAALVNAPVSRMGAEQLCRGCPEAQVLLSPALSQAL